MRPTAKRANDRGPSLSERLQILTQGNERLSSALSAMVKSSRTPHSLGALAALDSDAWRRVVAESGAAPAGVPGATADERLRTYARRLARLVALAFPTQVLAARMKADPPKTVAAATRYLAEHPEFELGRTPDSFVRANPPTAGTTTEVKTGLKAYQRIVSISPGVEAAAVLMKEGFRSALDIVDETRDDFVAGHPAEDCLTAAEMTYERAQATVIAGDINGTTAVKKRRSIPGQPHSGGGGAS